MRSDFFGILGGVFMGSAIYDLVVGEIVKIWSDDVLYRSALKLDARRQGMDPMGDSDFFGLLET